MSLETSRSPDDPYDFSYMQDGDDSREPSPNTAALMAPVGSMAPAYVSRTLDGRPRIMDLNNLGLQKGPALQGQGASRQEDGDVGRPRDGGYHTGQRDWPYDIPRNDRLAALQAEFTAPLQAQIWKQTQRQRMEDAVGRLHQTYVSEARSLNVPPEPPDPDLPSQYRHSDGIPASTVKPIELVPPHTPHGWEQDLAERARRATDRIQQEYVDELRHETHYMHNLRMKTLDEERKQRDLERVYQDFFSSDEFFKTRYIPQPRTYDDSSWEPPEPGDVASWDQQGPNEEVPLNAQPGPYDEFPTRSRNQPPDLCDLDAPSWAQSGLYDSLSDKRPPTDDPRHQLGNHGTMHPQVPPTGDPRHQVSDQATMHHAQVPITQNPRHQASDQATMHTTQVPLSQNLRHQVSDQATMHHSDHTQVPLTQDPRHQVSDQATMHHTELPLTEAELDEKRRQMLVQKKSKSKKVTKEGKSKKKSKGGKRGTKKPHNENIEAGNQIIPQPPKQDVNNEIIPHPPRQDTVAHPTRQDTVSHPPRQDAVPHPPGQNGLPQPQKKDTGNLIIPQPPMPCGGNEHVPHPPGQDAGQPCVPHQPAAPAKDKENEGGYSKRKRRLIAKGAEVGSSSSQPRLIPHQTSQQTMCWNSETAKRGLGFKSKQTREAEQEAKSKSAEAGQLSAEARNRWKKATFC